MRAVAYREKDEKEYKVKLFYISHEKAENLQQENEKADIDSVLLVPAYDYQILQEKYNNLIALLEKRNNEDRDIINYWKEK